MLVGSVVMVGKVELDSTFPIIQTVCRRSPQTPRTNILIYYIDIDEIPGFLLLLKNHIFTARSERIIFIFHM